jgi:hypothetical protein
MSFVNAHHLKELSRNTLNVYEISSADTKLYIIENSENENLTTYYLTKTPQIKAQADILFKWETPWYERIKFKD